MDVGNAGIEEGVESLDETLELDFQLVRANGGSVDRCVESRRVASGRKNSNTSHASVPRWDFDIV